MAHRREAKATAALKGGTGLDLLPDTRAREADFPSASSRGREQAVTGVFDRGCVIKPTDAAIPLSSRAGASMKRLVEGTDRSQSTFFPECLED